MRISLWPALVCGSMLSAMFGNTVHAAPPADDRSETVTQADAFDDDSDALEDSSSPPLALGGLNPYQPMQYVRDGASPPNGGGFAPGAMGFDPGMTAPNAWPETSPYTQ